MITRILLIFLILVCVAFSALFAIQDREIRQLNALLDTANRQSFTALNVGRPNAVAVEILGGGTLAAIRTPDGKWLEMCRTSPEWDVPTNRWESFIATGTNVLWITNIITHGFTNQ